MLLQPLHGGYIRHVSHSLSASSSVQVSPTSLWTQSSSLLEAQLPCSRPGSRVPWRTPACSSPRSFAPVCPVWPSRPSPISVPTGVCLGHEMWAQQLLSCQHIIFLVIFLPAKVGNRSIFFVQCRTYNVTEYIYMRERVSALAHRLQ